jgi:hypothetical protein
MFLAAFIEAVVGAAVRPGFFAEPVLEVVGPVAFVPGTIDVHINTISIGLILLPLSFIYYL